MRVCIVGGTGNISSSIVPLLLEQGHEVTCFNRGQTAALPEGVRQITGDRNNTEAFEATMQRENFDVAIDMICFSAEQAESSIRAFKGVQQFIQCSTVMVYGRQVNWMPVSEDHPLNPDNDYGIHKAAADAAYMRAYYNDNFPVTIIRPSTTQGPRGHIFRQIGWEFSWVDRVRKGKPILVCGDGTAIHQFMHTDDAALGFVGAIGKAHCIGQTYNLVKRGFNTWEDYHRTLMQIVGQEVEMVGIPLADLVALNTPGVDLCKDVFAHNSYYSAEKIMRDIPEFRPQHTLESYMRDTLAGADARGTIPNSDESDWEDKIIAAQRTVRQTQL